jgi:sugar/nucleoside kinase (ribokinase family)
MPNEREALKAARFDDLETAVQKLAVIVPLVVVKLGSEGVMAQPGTERFTSCPSRRIQPVESVDAVGAGDSFDAGFLHEYLHHGAYRLVSRLAISLARPLSPTRSGGIEAFRDAAYRQKFFEEHRSEK